MFCVTNHCPATEVLFSFVFKKKFGFNFKLVFVFALLVEQLPKVKMKDVSVMSFQC